MADDIKNCILNEKDAALKSLILNYFYRINQQRYNHENPLENIIT